MNGYFLELFSLLLNVLESTCELLKEICYRINEALSLESKIYFIY